MFRVCVVGSGPGGMYLTKYLLKELGTKARVDVVDKLPTMYGLVRYGVAPDHPEVKSVSNDFDAVMEDSRVRFYGNVAVGEDVQVSALRNIYDCVVLAYGAGNDRALGLDNEMETTNVWGAREFVNWYNGHPEMVDRSPPMLDCESAAVIGQGNVALDCARVLTKDIDDLAKTDISSQALELLSLSKIRSVSVVGRRGSAQAACTMKELRELTKLSNVGCMVRPEELEQSHTAASLEEIAKTRPVKRMDDLLTKTSLGYDNAAKQKRNVQLRFLASPSAIHSDPNGRIASITLQHNKLIGEPFHQKAVPITDSFEQLDCGLLIRSIGYKSTPLEGVPFDTQNNVVKHTHGKVEDGLYASGWVKRGPVGIIGTNIVDAKDTVHTMVHDLEGATAKQSSVELMDILPEEAKGKVVSWEGYQTINKEEELRGSQSTPPKPRDKMLTKAEMLEYGLK
mmetsp:Transcript_24990/g.40556  ORF Transcript_24990/g.40556 Transcript_24990/m.40556 type:complete len:453 (+) Transcript_24990:70-1428(+)